MKFFEKKCYYPLNNFHEKFRSEFDLKLEKINHGFYFTFLRVCQKGWEKVEVISKRHYPIVCIRKEILMSTKIIVD